MFMDAYRRILALGARAIYNVARASRRQLDFVYSRVPAPARRAVGERLREVGWLNRPPPPQPASLVPGMTLVGYPFGEMGLGEALRSLARSALASDIPTHAYSFDLHIASRQRDRSIASIVRDRLEHTTNVFCVNADLLGETMRGIGAASLAGRYNILRPYWELPRLPARWDDAMERMDEIWAPTRFVRDAYAERFAGPVIDIPVAITVPANPDVDRRAFGLPSDTFLFLFAFDLGSYSARKNPFAAIEAFERAFGRDPKGVGLVVKTNGDGPRGDRSLARLRASARANPAIHLVEGTRSRAATMNLIASCDAFVSLHRAEGFGLAIAEAMAMGKPAIATDYSGNKDFMSAANSLLVPYRLVEVRPDEYLYHEPGQTWAEPDLDAAAAAMSRVFNDRAFAATIGAAARSHMQAHHSPAVAGRKIRARLVELGLLDGTETAP